MVFRGVLAFALMALLAADRVHAQEVWTVLPPSARGVDPAAGETYRDLLQHELGAAMPGVTFAGGVLSPCADTACAVTAGGAVGADVAVYGSLNALGTEIVATATAVEVATGATRSSQRLTVDRIEELDTAAQRIARAIGEGIPVEETAELGSITTLESQPPTRREGDSGLAMRLGAMIPLGDTYGGTNAGIAIDISYWFEALRFAIEPRFGFRFATDRTDHNFFEIPFELAGYYILGLGDTAPFFGGGTGVRWVHESRPITQRTGTVIQTEQHKVFDENGWGFSMFARAGLLLLRTYTTRITFSVDYNAVFLDLNDAGTLQSLTAGVGIIF